jgi:hypothetical protein
MLARQYSFDFLAELEMIPEFAPAPKDIVWTDEEVEILRAEVLKDALNSLLDGRCGAKVKAEAVEWIQADEEAPFSFNVCARAEGMRPEVLREYALGEYEHTQKMKAKAKAVKAKAA